MNYFVFRQKMKSFPIFSVQEIEKQFPDFDSRRLVEWQAKGYIQNLEIATIVLKMSRLMNHPAIILPISCIAPRMYPWNQHLSITALFRREYFKLFPALP